MVHKFRLNCCHKRHILLIVAVSLPLTALILVLQASSQLETGNLSARTGTSSFLRTSSAPSTSVYKRIETARPTTAILSSSSIQRYLVENVRKLSPDDELYQKLLRMDKYIASLRSHLPDEFLREFKNPCWYSEIKIPSSINDLTIPLITQKLNTSLFKLKEDRLLMQSSDMPVPRLHSKSTKGQDKFLYCLPYFFLLGYAKTGTSTVYSLITKISLFAKPVGKELQWWTWYPYQTTEALSSLYFKRYLAHFVPAAFKISTSTEMITADCSVLAAFGPPFRTNSTSVLPGFMPYMYSQLFKQQKFIIVMRDPVFRVRSGFYYHNLEYFAGLQEKGTFTPNITTYLLHLTVLQHTAAFEKCMELTQGDGSMCIYDYYDHIVPDERIPSCIILPLGSSIYYYSLYYWLYYIPRERFLFIRTEELQNQSVLLHELVKFLDLPEHVVPDRVRNMHSNQGVSSASSSSIYMETETEKILRDFFIPYNNKLAALLNNRKYLWKG